jgi:hypothetical protein
MRVRVKDDAGGAVAEVVLGEGVTKWGQPLLDALAAAVGLPSVGAVWVLYDGGEIEGPLPGGRGSWKIVNEPDATVLVTAGAGPAPGARSPQPTVPASPVTPAQHAMSPLVSPMPMDAAARAGIELPTPTEDERNWSRVQALFHDEPCPVPRIMQQVSTSAATCIHAGLSVSSDLLPQPAQPPLL